MSFSLFCLFFLNNSVFRSLFSISISYSTLPLTAIFNPHSHLQCSCNNPAPVRFTFHVRHMSNRVGCLSIIYQAQTTTVAELQKNAPFDYAAGHDEGFQFLLFLLHIGPIPNFLIPINHLDLKGWKKQEPGLKKYQQSSFKLQISWSRACNLHKPAYFVT